jgi:hypothetical protein
MYYPGSVDPNRASALDLHAGDQLPGVDFTLVPVKTFNVRGRVFDAVNSRPGMHATVWLEPRDAEGQNEIATSQNLQDVEDAQGVFELHGVTSGSY